MDERKAFDEKRSELTSVDTKIAELRQREADLGAIDESRAAADGAAKGQSTPVAPVANPFRKR